jgi:4-amino-4-deoxy-L-arabinose transferase-like glycosyltransferase
MAEHASPTDAAARQRLGLALLLAAQLALALVGAARKSLVQDELHTRFHASAASLGELFANLRLDNHPPLGFLLVRAGRNLLGDSELALRAPLILCGLTGTLLVARLCARLGAPALLGAAAWALGSAQLEFSTQSHVRPERPVLRRRARRAGAARRG